MSRVLVVDDNFLNRKLIIEIISDIAQCDVAVNGKEALEAYALSNEKNDPYDLILLDIAMPGIDGIEVLKHVRDAEATRGVLLGEGLPIIMTTAYKEPFLDAFSKGCDDYILKPIQPEVLLQKVKEKLGLS